MSGYRLLARIGEGGMGSVYLSRTRGGQPVALKVIRREYAQDAEFRRRFEHEAQAAGQVRGYHVVPVVDHDTAGQQPWLATAFVPGLPLDEALRAGGPLPLSAALQLTGCAAEALRAVHAAGVIHRDMKPSNILLGHEGPWVIDFGIARAADATQLTRSGGLIGTPQYMSPEHADGRPLTPATDVFSLGLVAAVAATGLHPYGNAGAITLATKIANTEARPPDLSGYPEPLRQILERCLTADPADRATPEELAALCEQAAGRRLRDFSGWLPEPLAAEIARRGERAALVPEPAEPDSAATYAPPAPTRPPAQPPLSTSYPPPASPPSGPLPYAPVPSAPVPSGPVPSGPVPSGPPSAAARPARRQTPLLVGAVLTAAVLVAGAVWVSGQDDPKGNRSAGGPTTTAPGAAPAPQQSSPAEAASASATPAKVTPKATGRYELIFDRKPFSIRGPGDAQFSRIDLDAPQVVSISAPFGDDEMEMVYQDAHSEHSKLSFRTTTGTSAGTSADECRSDAGANAVRREMQAKELGATLTPGTILCTVTSKGNLAMLRITAVEPSGTAYDFTTELTLWSIP
ncbi:serine/threonine-protein kinase [Kitasatospora sp. NPDC057223]|uniref:serine/threonine-protein kinase n=1 Tax=Kitasatospora sp. NPDC057223 TaxID=3346055 RepID=UPI003639874A